MFSEKNNINFLQPLMGVDGREINQKVIYLKIKISKIGKNIILLKS